MNDDVKDVRPGDWVRLHPMQILTMEGGGRVTLQCGSLQHGTYVCVAVPPSAIESKAESPVVEWRRVQPGTEVFVSSSGKEHKRIHAEFVGYTEVGNRPFLVVVNGDRGVTSWIRCWLAYPERDTPL